MTSCVFTIVVSLVLSTVYVYLRIHGVNVEKLPFPPGPVPHFLLGNLYDIPSGENQWSVYRALSNACGKISLVLTSYYDLSSFLESDIVYLTTLTKSILAINSYQAANDLLDKRGAIYSDRPDFPMIKHL